MEATPGMSTRIELRGSPFDNGNFGADSAAMARSPIMPEHLPKSRFVVPAFVKSLEYVHELLFVEPVQVGYHRVEFRDHVLLFAVLERAAINANGFCPSRKPLVGT